MEDFVDAVIDFIRTNKDWAGPIVFALSFAESLAIISLFAPATVILFAAGALAGTGVLDPWVLSAWAIPGAALGDAVSYWFGYYFRNSIPKIWPFTSYPKLLESGRAFFARWGVLSVFLGRFMGPLRAVVPLVAGMMEMPHRAFQIANVTSAIIWAPVVFFQGALMGIALKWLSDQLGLEALIALAAGLGIIGVIGWYGLKRLRQRKKSKSEE